MAEVTFKADKKHRDKYFSAGSFAHPAKMMLPLQRWLIEKYSRPGDVILDPMAGQGTLLIACTMGRHVIMVELESKFVQMQNDNWAKIQTLGPEMGYEMGVATILQGDARNLEGLLVDKCIFSPPYAEASHHSDNARELDDFKPGRSARVGGTAGNSEGQIGQLPYGEIDKIITSPPYSNEHASALSEKTIKEAERIHNRRYSRRSFTGGEDYGKSKDNIGNLPYGKLADVIMSSPPYWDNKSDWDRKSHAALEGETVTYSDEVGRDQRANIGNIHYYNGAAPLSGKYSRAKEGDETYLGAMLQVYQQCYKVLKPQGLMILVTKNFIRDRKVIRLDLDTIKLCEQAGFQFVERHYRQLTSQSFWRTIYHQKYPDAPILNKEDILVFKRL